MAGDQIVSRDHVPDQAGPLTKHEGFHEDREVGQDAVDVDRIERVYK